MSDQNQNPSKPNMFTRVGDSIQHSLDNHRIIGGVAVGAAAVGAYEGGKYLVTKGSSFVKSKLAKKPAEKAASSSAAAAFGGLLKGLR